MEKKLNKITVKAASDENHVFIHYDRYLSISCFILQFNNDSVQKNDFTQLSSSMKKT